MKETNKKEMPLLSTEDIEVKVKQVTKTGALALLYKTARTDRKYLNMVYGPMNWTSNYKEIKDNLYCGIGVRENSDQDFVWKWDCGIESRADEQGNEKKGEASDAFKRAGYQWNIGEELYTAPMIFLNVATEQDKNGNWKLKDPYARYVVTDIEYNQDTRTIIKLKIANEKNNIIVFEYQLPTTGARALKMKETVKTIEEDNNLKNNNTVESKEESPMAMNFKDEDIFKPSLSSLINSIGHIVKKMSIQEGSIAKYSQIIQEITGGNTFKCNAATDDDYNIVEKIYNKLKELGYEE